MEQEPWTGKKWQEISVKRRAYSEAVLLNQQSHLQPRLPIKWFSQWVTYQPWMLWRNLEQRKTKQSKRARVRICAGSRSIGDNISPHSCLLFILIKNYDIQVFTTPSQLLLTWKLWTHPRRSVQGGLVWQPTSIASKESVCTRKKSRGPWVVERVEQIE